MDGGVGGWARGWTHRIGSIATEPHTCFKLTDSCLYHGYMLPPPCAAAGGVARKYGAPFEVESCKAKFFEIYMAKYCVPGGRAGGTGRRWGWALLSGRLQAGAGSAHPP